MLFIRRKIMAGSYNHVIIKKTGNLIGNEPPRGAPFSDMIENLGDAYEAIEEMYGMIWYLATTLAPEDKLVAKAAVEQARKNYKEGLKRSQVIHRVYPNRGD
jgi:hypothetical protein